MAHSSAFHEGYSAFESGFVYSSNPYPFNTRKFEQWRAGFQTAHDEFVYDDIIDNLEVENEHSISLVLYHERFPE
jgi:hypothetical protein